MLTLSRRQVHAWRLERQWLVGRATDGPVEVTRRLCGVQAQVMSAAAQAISVRTGGPAPPVVEALDEGRLVRTWAMRGTLHLLPADEAGRWLSLLAAARTWTKGSWQKTFVTTDRLEAFADVVHDLLADGRAATRDDLVAAAVRVDAGLAEQVASSWGAVLKPLAWRGLLVHGPTDGSRTTFVRPDVALPGWLAPGDPDEAAPDAVRAYLGAHGPASPTAFDAWLLRGSTPRARLRSWFAAVAGETTAVEVDGRPAVALTEHLDALATAADRVEGVVRLLPAFDQFVLGPGTADPHVVPAARRGDVSRAAGWIAPVVVTVDGVIGTWSSDAGRVAVTLFPGAPAPDPDTLAHEIDRAGQAAGQG